MVTADPTQEAIDPVRYITNHSFRKDGICHCKNGHAAAERRSRW
ncbi:MAG: phosphopantothenoylcysteine decarboxylase [Blautia faecis]